MSSRMLNLYLRLRNRLVMRQEGQGLAEYAVVLALIAVVISLAERNAALAR